MKGIQLISRFNTIFLLNRFVKFIYESNNKYTFAFIKSIYYSITHIYHK